VLQGVGSTQETAGINTGEGGQLDACCLYSSGPMLCLYAC